MASATGCGAQGWRPTNGSPRLVRTRPAESWQDSLRVFLENLEDGQTPEWQLRQAADAVSLYFGQYQSFLAGGAPSPSPTERPGFDRGAALSEDAKIYLSQLATRDRVSASTQNQAFSALLFLHRYVLQADFGDMAATIRARRGRRLPVVLTVDEVRAILGALSGRSRTMLELIYGGGLRLNELVQLRVKDIDFGAGTIAIRAGKGDLDRFTLLPRRLHAELRSHLKQVEALHQRDLAAGAGEAPLPDALRRPLTPRRARRWSAA